jgi:NAD-dependent deacetylase
MNAQIEQAIELIKNSERIVALSGAGISTEAGVPDFRGPGGMWEDSDLMELLSASGFKRDPESFYRASLPLFSKISAAKPTLAHQLLVRLETLGKIEAVVTQNIDGLHQAAGSTRVYELHGTYRTGRCTLCGKAYTMSGFYSEIEKGLLRVPRCADCRKPLKPDIVLFEELLPVDAWQDSLEAVHQSDLMMVLGSSLVVYPAAELPQIALSCGAKLIIVNLERTGYDIMAAVTVRERLGDFAQAVLAALK